MLNDNQKRKSSLQAYLGISKSNRALFDQELEMVRKLFSQHNIVLNIFVEQYNFSVDEDKQMMEKAFADIDHSDFLIVELSKKAIGVGAEVGYAKAKNKPIIYLKRKSSAYSTTVGGSSDYLIEYTGIEDLKDKLAKTLLKLIEKFV